MYEPRSAARRARRDVLFGRQPTGATRLRPPRTGTPRGQKRRRTHGDALRRPRRLRRRPNRVRRQHRLEQGSERGRTGDLRAPPRPAGEDRTRHVRLLCGRTTPALSAARKSDAARRGVAREGVHSGRGDIRRDRTLRRLRRPRTVRHREGRKRVERREYPRRATLVRPREDGRRGRDGHPNRRTDGRGGLRSDLHDWTRRRTKSAANGRTSNSSSTPSSRGG